MQALQVDYNELISKIIKKQNLTYNEAYQGMVGMVSAQFSPPQMAAILTSLTCKGETPEEIAGFSQAMLDHAKKITYSGNKPVIDIVGTGGAPFKTFNVSTTASFIAPLFDVAVAKHGNRSTTSMSGSADLLEALGVNIMMSPTKAQQCLETIGLTFMFAPTYHPAMKNVVPVRKELQFRTIFNLLGPLTNPCQVKRQLTGVFREDLLLPIAESLKARNYARTALVHSSLGADEITTAGTTSVVELNRGEISQYSVDSSSFGFPPANPKELGNLPPLQAAKETIKILSGEPSPRADFVVANAAMALKTADRFEDLKEGAVAIKDMLQTGKALDLLTDFVKLSGGDEEQLQNIMG